MNNMFGNLLGGTNNKFMDRLFRKVDNVVWDLMSGKLGVATKDGIATLEGEGLDAQVNLNLLDQFGMSIPAFAQSTPIAGVAKGDIIFFGASDRPGWVIEKIAGDEATGKRPKFTLMKVDGTTSAWTPPKVSMLGMESGVMVLKSLLTMLPGGSAGLGGLQTMLLPMLMMNGGDSSSIEDLLPMLLMGQMQAAPVVAADGTTTVAPNPMAQMLPMMFQMKMMEKLMGDKNSRSRNDPFRG